MNIYHAQAAGPAYRRHYSGVSKQAGAFWVHSSFRTFSVHFCILILLVIIVFLILTIFQCFDTVGWVTGRASGM